MSNVVSLSSTMQMYKEMLAKQQPITFVKDPYFLGRKPYPKQEQIFTDFYANPKVMMLIIIAGMRGGKTRLAADIVCYEAFTLLTTPNIYEQYGLEKDSKFYIFCVATSEDQAEDTIYAAVKSSMSNSPFFQKYGVECYANEIRFGKHPVEIKAGLSSALALVGRTVKANVFDELDRLEKTEGKRSAELVYSSLSKSTTSFQFAGKNVVITSPLYTESKANTLAEQNRDNPYAQVYAPLPTWEMNPNLPFDGEFLQAKLKEDPITFWRDYGAIPQASVDRFFKDESILRFDQSILNVFESGTAWDYWKLRQRTNPVKLILGADPAGTMDSFGLALGYKEDDQYYIVGIKRFSPEAIKDQQMMKKLGKRVAMEINPMIVKKEILSAVNDLRVRLFVSDTWQYPELQKELQLGGVQVLNNLVKLEHYELFRKLAYANQFHCCENVKILEEWKNLIQLNAKHVDHPKGGSKDLSDAVCNVIWAAGATEPVPWAPPLMAPFQMR